MTERRPATSEEQARCRELDCGPEGWHEDCPLHSPFDEVDKPFLVLLRGDDPIAAACVDLQPLGGNKAVWFAEGCMDRADHAEDRDTACKWATAAFRAYRHHGCDSCWSSSMMLRVRLIDRFGAGGVADPGVIVEWFKSAMPFPFAEAIEKARGWRCADTDMTLDDLKTLRGIKNRLGVIRELATLCPEAIDKDLGHALVLMSALP